MTTTQNHTLFFIFTFIPCQIERGTNYKTTITQCARRATVTVDSECGYGPLFLGWEIDIPFRASPRPNSLIDTISNNNGHWVKRRSRRGTGEEHSHTYQWRPFMVNGLWKAVHHKWLPLICVAVFFSCFLRSPWVVVPKYIVICSSIACHRCYVECCRMLPEQYSWI